MIDRTETHQRENNEGSENHLQENQKKFSRQCLLVLQLLQSGIRLTCKSALINYSIGHLPRRLADLKENGVKIDEVWLKDSKGKNVAKEWFIMPIKRPTKKSVIEKYLKQIPPGKDKWVQPNLL